MEDLDDLGSAKITSALGKVLSRVVQAELVLGVSASWELETIRPRFLGLGFRV